MSGADAHRYGMAMREMLKRKALFPGFLACYALLSFYVVIIFLIGSDFGGQNRHTFENMLDGTGQRPIVYRMLLPTVVNVIIYALPTAWLQVVNELTASVRDGALMTIAIHVRHSDLPTSLNDNARLYETAIFVLVVWLCLVGYMTVLYRMAAYFMPQSRAYAFFAPIFGTLLLPVVHEDFAYPYDYGMLLLVSASLYCMARERWLAYYILLELATMNKETAIYIPFVYAVYFFGRQPLRQYVISVMAQLAVYTLITVMIRMYYEHSLASYGVFFTTRPQLRILFEGYSYNTFIALLATFFLMTFRWREKPVFLRCGLWMLLPLSVVFLFMGWPHEYRQLLDVAPIATLLITHTLITATGIARSSQPVLTTHSATT